MADSHVALLGDTLAPPQAEGRAPAGRSHCRHRVSLRWSLVAALGMGFSVLFFTCGTRSGLNHLAVASIAMASMVPSFVRQRAVPARRGHASTGQIALLQSRLGRGRSSPARRAFFRSDEEGNPYPKFEAGNLSGFVTSNYGVQVPRLIYMTNYVNTQEESLTYSSNPMSTQSRVVAAVLGGFKGVAVPSGAEMELYQRELGEARKQMQAFAIPREALFFQSKVPRDNILPLTMHVPISVEDACRDMYVDYLDCMMMETWSEHETTMAAWRALEDAMQESLFRQPGVENAKDLDALRKIYDESTIKPGIVQQNIIGENGLDREMIEWCNEKGIILQTTSSWEQLKIEFDGLEKKYGVTSGALFYRFLMGLGVVPIVDSQSVLDLTKTIALTMEDAETIGSLLVKAR